MDLASSASEFCRDFFDSIVKGKVPCLCVFCTCSYLEIEIRIIMPNNVSVRVGCYILNISIHNNGNQNNGVG